jgi:hypothetical protein
MIAHLHPKPGACRKFRKCLNPRLDEVLAGEAILPREACRSNPDRPDLRADGLRTPACHLFLPDAGPQALAVGSG